MISANELSGVLAMMPAFATPDAIDIRATETIAVDNLREAVERIVRAAVTADAVNKRVPLFIGCTSPNPGEVVQKMNFLKDLGADGVLLGVPYYETIHVQDAITFYHEIADMYPG
jgi:trans-o-hydroxybenzylidenepyruvate hydratase-aldolase